MTTTKDTSLVASPSPDRALEMREQARHALTECRTTFDAMEVRNRAEAIRAYSKAAKDRTLEIEAMEIRADAERKLGQLLEDMPRNTGARGIGTSAVPNGNRTPTLSDIGVSKKLSMQSRQFAGLNDEAWEAHKAEWREEMATKPHGRVKVLRPKPPPAPEPADIPPPPEDRSYAVVVVDPPWPVKPLELKDTGTGGHIGYPVMSISAIEETTLPATDAHVFLWTTQRFLPAALRLFDVWGVRYSLTYVWRKPDGFQPPGLPKYNCEFCLYGRIGKPPQELHRKDWWACFDAPRAGHSVKPDSFYSMLRKRYPGPRLDMFNRRRIPGFDGWGNEAV